jgi:hypothetical protein
VVADLGPGSGAVFTALRDAIRASLQPRRGRPCVTHTEIVIISGKGGTGKTSSPRLRALAARRATP